MGLPPITIPEHVLNCNQFNWEKAREQIMYPTGTPEAHIQYVRQWVDLLKPALVLAPRGALLDIGCGLAVFDTIIARTTERKGMYLLDALTDSEEKQQISGNATKPWFSALAARDVVTANVKDVAPTVINWTTGIPDNQVALAVSFRAMGYHFPVESYARELERVVVPEGILIFDQRAGEDPALVPGFTHLPKLTWRTDKFVRRTYQRDAS